MQPPRFFGYGSLVNRATHSYPNACPATLAGWRRIWVTTPARPLAYLSVIRDPACTLHGLVADVPGGDWAALDLREAAYTRHTVEAQTLTPPGPTPAEVYAVPRTAARAAQPILLSYLDTVIQGFVREYGPSGATGFFATTTGWDAPILNDRASPRYPRAQRLTAAERAAVEDGLATVGGTVSAGQGGSK